MRVSGVRAPPLTAARKRQSTQGSWPSERSQNGTLARRRSKTPNTEGTGEPCFTSPRLCRSCGTPVRSAGASRLLLLLACLLGTLTAVAQVEPVADGCPPTPPPYQYLRFDEDYFYLHNPLCRTEALDSWKYIPLG